MFAYSIAINHSIEKHYENPKKSFSMPFSPKNFWLANLHHIGRKYSENLIQHWVWVAGSNPRIDSFPSQK